WPGNVRELELLLERACNTQQSSKLTPEMVDAWINAPLPFEVTNSGVTLALMERQLIEATFSRCAGNRELTAQTLQIGLRTLSGKLRDYGYPPRGGPGSNQLSREREAA
ncbi:MAG: sigma-54 factor interaction protein, partial [Planctomycetaceae bacterium]|nr:sigma-54 factor interaction protein [Planctomycetaceae bacterium]